MKSVSEQMSHAQSTSADGPWLHQSEAAPVLFPIMISLKETHAGLQLVPASYKISNSELFVKIFKHMLFFKITSRVS